MDEKVMSRTMNRPNERRSTGAWGCLTSVFRGIDLARRVVVNLVFLFLLVLLLALAGSEDVILVPDSAVLVVDPQGFIVEQLAGDPFERAFQELSGSPILETLLADLVDAVDEARDDRRIKGLYLDLDALFGAGLPKLESLQAAIYRFKESGKPVIARSSFYDNARYHLASAADEIYLDTMGIVAFEGYNRYQTYYKEGIDRFGVDFNVFRVGEYKSAVEPYLRDDMSPEAEEANLAWLGDLWGAFLDDVARARNLAAEDVGALMENYNDFLGASGGSTSQMALQLGLVDRVGSLETVRQRLVEIAGVAEDGFSYSGITFSDYLTALGHDRTTAGGRPAVGVIVARGLILPGIQPPGTIGDRTLIELLRQARSDADVAALVLRIDSGGGSTFASEAIRAEVAALRDSGKPVVVSMSSVAASGAYWISTAADRIWASPNTLTGSIGIFGTFPTFQKPLREYLGVRVDGVGTSWLGRVRPDLEMPGEMRQMLQQMLEHDYGRFLELVAEARGVSVEDVDRIARGRVWSGEDALEIGLVDELGGLEEAMAAAAELAELGEDWRGVYIEEELSFADQLMLELISGAKAYVPASALGRSAVWRRLEKWLADELVPAVEFEDPRGIFAHCFCEVEG